MKDLTGGSNLQAILNVEKKIDKNLIHRRSTLIPLFSANIVHDQQIPTRSATSLSHDIVPLYFPEGRSR